MSVQWCNWTLSDTNKIYCNTEILSVTESVQLRHWILSIRGRRSAIRLTVSSCLAKGFSRSVSQQVVPLNLNGLKFSSRETSVHLWLCPFLYNVYHVRLFYCKFLFFILPLISEPMFPKISNFKAEITLAKFWNSYSVQSRPSHKQKFLANIFLTFFSINSN
jgi:hypothetical protein